MGSLHQNSDLTDFDSVWPLLIATNKPDLRLHYIRCRRSREKTPRRENANKPRLQISKMVVKWKTQAPI